MDDNEKEEKTEELSEEVEKQKDVETKQDKAQENINNSQTEKEEEKNSKVEETEKTEKVKKEKSKKSKKIGIIITIVILVTIIVSSIGGIFLYKYLELKAPIDISWGETYYKYLKQVIIDGEKTKQEIGLEDEMENAKIEFAEVEDEKDPVMIISYDKNDEDYYNIYHIKETGVTYTKLDESSDIDFLYNIEQKEYNFYVHKENETEDTYQPVKNIINDNEEEKLPEYTIKKGEETVQETAQGEEITISKYDEIFIEPEVDGSEKIDFNVNFSESDIKSAVENAISGYKTKEDIITSEVKQKVTLKEQEIVDKQEEIKVAKEEIAKIEEEKIKITKENLQEKLGEHLKWFGYAYMGVDYGIYQVYDLEDRTGEVVIPNTQSEFLMTEELVGAKSIQDIKTTMNSYVSQNVINKLQEQSIWNSTGEDYTSSLYDYNGKVYIVRGGIGGGPYIKYENARVLSSEDGITKIQLEEYESLGDFLDARITITVEYNKETEKYLITDCEVTNF